ncbi:type 4a pilus biogenesis protein PilO, partial [Enterococcus casseliflavus]|uniref:type 4a pilus biogenesis protein PilO n=1 Tax=Enterococcus casseliflavus TaxID=37734 RepID=UPI003D11C083
IVTLHDIEITPKGNQPGFDDLVLNVTAKTYRYLDEAEQSEAEGPADGDPKARARAQAKAARDAKKPAKAGAEKKG